MTFMPHFELDAPEGRPRGWILFLHGIYGSGVNWQSFVRRFVAGGTQGWGGVRVDLRMHGESQAAPGPHTVEAAARDLLALESQLSEPILGISGHSFGGKVALEYARLKGGNLERVWVLDSDPAPQPQRDIADPQSADSVLRVLALLDLLPAHFANRGEFLALMKTQGIERPVAQWLAKNLVVSDAGVRFRLEAPAMRELLTDYFQRDLLSVAEEEVLAERIDFVFGGASAAVPASTRERLQELQDAQFQCHTIPDAGHWLHVAAPDALLDILLA